MKDNRTELYCKQNHCTNLFIIRLKEKSNPMDCTNSDDIVKYLVNQLETNQATVEPAVIQEDVPEENDSYSDEHVPKKAIKRGANIPKSTDFYDTAIPNFTEEEFRYYFRMSRICFGSIMDKLSKKVKIFNLEKKLLFSIWMLSTRDSFFAVSTRFGLAKGAAYQYFCEIIDGLVVLFKDHVSWPGDLEFSHIEQGFKPKTGGYVPGIIGAIDGCHIQIKKPSRYSIYCNERKTHSIILQAVCDNQKIFTDVYVGAPGCLHAGRVFRNSPLSKEIENLIPEDYHIVGNSSYPQMKNLVVPFVDEGMLTETQEHFNNCLLSACATVEEAFRLLLARFRRLTYLDTSKPELANKMVCACIILHNHILMTDPADDVEQLIRDESPEVFLNADVEGATGENADCDGLIKRNYLLSLFDFI